MRIILHLDMDAFFASVEERDKPWLKGKPIVVGADPKDGLGRGVVSTANYAARKYGIHSALPISRAWKLSEQARRGGKPPAVFLTGNYGRYEEVSSHIMEIIGKQVDILEPASIDEAYGDISSECDFKKAESLAKKIKKEILDKEKLTSSVGIGPNKLIAKIAAGTQKPNGLTIIRPEFVQDFLDPMKTKEIPGIGPKSFEFLERKNIHTIKELREADREKLVEWFGKWGFEMYERANGRDNNLVISNYETKSIGEQETFEADILDPPFLLNRIKSLCRGIQNRLQKERFIWKTIAVTIRFSDFKTISRSRTLEDYTDVAATLEMEAFKILIPYLDARKNPEKNLIRLLGVRVEKLKLAASKLF